LCDKDKIICNSVDYHKRKNTDYPDSLRFYFAGACFTHFNQSNPYNHKMLTDKYLEYII